MARNDYENAYDAIAREEMKEKEAVEAKFERGFKILEDYVRTQQELNVIRQGELAAKKELASKLDALIDIASTYVDIIYSK